MPRLAAMIAFCLSLSLLPSPLCCQDTTEVVTALDAGELSSLEEFSPLEIIEALQKERSFPEIEAGSRSVSITSADGRESDLWVVVPQGEFERYGVMVMLHGYGGGGNQVHSGFYRQFAAREGLLVVSPSAQPLEEKYRPEDLPDRLLGNPVMHWWSYRSDGFIDAAIDWAKGVAAIDEERIFLSGYSMGGYATWNLGMRFSDRFAALVPIAGGTSLREGPINGPDERIRSLLVNLMHLPAYVVHGDSDELVPALYDTRSIKTLTELGYPHRYHEIAGGKHMLPVREGTAAMKSIQRWLGDKKRESHPREIRHRVLDVNHGRCYWLRIDKLIDDEKPGEVRARIDKRNRIALVSENVQALTIFIDEELIDLKKTVRISQKGKTLFRGKVKASSERILDSWKGRRDPDLVYRAAVQLQVAGRGR